MCMALINTILNIDCMDRDQVSVFMCFPHLHFPYFNTVKQSKRLKRVLLIPASEPALGFPFFGGKLLRNFGKMLKSCKGR